MEKKLSGPCSINEKIAITTKKIQTLENLHARAPNNLHKVARAPADLKEMFRILLDRIVKPKHLLQHPDA
jgi:hypothetical protein